MTSAVNERSPWQIFWREFKKSPVLAVLFTCNHCPTAQMYEDRIKALVKASALFSSDDVVHGLLANPETAQALAHAFGTFTALMSPALPLARRQQEMIATMVSATNHCH